MSRWPIFGLLVTTGCALSFEPAAGPDLDVGTSSDVGPSADAAVEDGGFEDARSDAGVEVTILLSTAGSADAWVRSTPSDLDCTGVCPFVVSLGSAWSLFAEPGSATHFNKWRSGPCEGSTDPICSFTAVANLQIRAEYDRN